MAPVNRARGLHFLGRYLLAMIIAAIAAGLWVLLHPIYDLSLLMPFFVASAVGIWITGLGPGMLILLAGAAAGGWLLLVDPPAGMSTTLLLDRYVIYLSTSFIIAALAEMRRLRTRRNQQEAVTTEVKRAATAESAEVVRLQESLRTSRERMRMQAAVGAAIGSQPIMDGAPARVATLLTAELADWCAIDLTRPDGVGERAALAARGLLSETERLPEALQASQLPEGATALNLQRSEMTDTEQNGSLAHEQPLRAALAPLLAEGFDDVLVTPIRRWGQPAGALTLALRSGSGGFPADDRLLAEDIALRLGQQLERQSLHETAISATARARGAFATSLDAMLLIDEQGRYIEANESAARMFGYTREDLIRMQVGDLPVVGAAWTDEDRERFAHGGQWTGEMLVRRQDGANVPVEVRVSAVSCAGQTEYLAVLRDISARHLLQRVRQDVRGLLHGELQRRRTSLMGLIGGIQRPSS